MTVHPAAASPWRDAFVGVEQQVPVAAGGRRTYVNFDNAASTPPFRTVRDAVAAFAEWYSSVHRGTGYKSRLATEAYEEAREVVRAHVRAGVDQTVVFVKNTTEGVNKVSRKLEADDDRLVLMTLMDHHSNLLPWRHRSGGIRAGVRPDGRLDIDELAEKLRENAGRIGLVAVAGASNVTGYMPPIHRIAALAHEHGARIFVDAAQLAPHHPIDVKPSDDPEHLDFVVFSGHKLYAPYGSGALVAPSDFFGGEPDLLGGGAVEIVTPDDIVWTHAPHLEEAGTPNVVGAVALAVALRTLAECGIERIVEHERALTRRLLAGLQRVPGVTIYGSGDPEALDDRLGLVTFNLDGLHHSLVAAALSWEWGIGVRDGCFCAHPYLLHLFGLDDETIEDARTSIRNGCKVDVPGAVRASLAPYNTPAEVALFLEAVAAIAAGDIGEEYVQDRVTGAYTPAAGLPPVPSIFTLGAASAE